MTRAPSTPTGRLPWRAALVTGASSGIGDALVRLLAKGQVATIVLVARRAERLDALAFELTAAHPNLRTEVLTADLVDPDDRARVVARLLDDEAPIDLVVNNAGFGTAGAFWELDPDREQRQIDLNVASVVALSHAALGPMVARGRGALVNVSSLASNQPTPGMATYSATKAFVTMFTEGLAEELRDTGVSATAVLPGFTRTEFAASIGTGADASSDADAASPEEVVAAAEAMAPAFAWLSAEQVAAETLQAAATGKVLCIPGLGYKVVNALEAPLPRTARGWGVSRLSGIPARLAR